MTKPSISIKILGNFLKNTRFYFYCSKVRIFKNTYFQKHVLSKTRTFKNPGFQKSVLFKNTYFSKVRPFQKYVLFKNTSFSKIRTFFKNSVLFQNFRVFKKFPVPKSVLFNFSLKLDFYSKIRFVNINMWVSPILYRAFIILYPF